jgi:hypothetical protein
MVLLIQLLSLQMGSKCLQLEVGYFLAIANEIDGGDIYKWDLGTRKCITRFKDEGAKSCESLSISNDGTYLVSGYDKH